ncbi:putative bifunctional diguanylate cyclase/phosphodiesterase [Ilumatobacter sp.]|uniref:putative bifunctional diguanylate cyclase/phosphodiesterase n=1 Tax=Ilumatobacter sp. TaxID=1967498 RepID=UPI003B5258CA
MDRDGCVRTTHRAFDDPTAEHHHDEHHHDAEHHHDIVGSRIVDVVARLDADAAPRCAAALASRGTTSFTSAAGRAFHVAPLDAGDGLVIVTPAPGHGGEARRARIDEASSDELTGAGDRRLLSRNLSAWPASAPLTLLMIDLDRFKHVNDTLGHGAGDRLLVLVADRIRAATRRDDDRLYRLGGDEFVVAHVPDGDGSAERVARRIVEFVSRPFLIEGQQVNVGASIGVASLSDISTPDLILQHADLALHSAKAAGRGCVRSFEPSFQDRATEQRDRELRLRRALSLDELSLVYQPQIALREPRVCGFEALLRWDNPFLGRVPPDVFIPLAEETGDIHPIGRWVLETACLEAMRWPSDLVVAVNVSAVQFARADFVDIVSEALRTSGLAADRLELEITESVLLERTDCSIARLWALRDMGVRVAMDDFGTGYSSLSYLHSFPFSSIKIDQSFVRGEQTDRSRTLVRAIVALGSSLGMTTIAEGVETLEQYRELADQGCQEVQGYYFARPMLPTDISSYLHRPLPPTVDVDGR